MRKVDEINTNLTEEITPRLDELRGQKTHYLKWKANDGEENRLQKFCVAYSYNQAETTLNSSEEEKKELEAEQQSLQAAKEQAEVKCQCSCVHVCVLPGRPCTSGIKPRCIECVGNSLCWTGRSMSWVWRCFWQGTVHMVCADCFLSCCDEEPVCVLFC